MIVKSARLPDALVAASFRKRQPDEAILHFADLPASAIRRQDGYRITAPLQMLLDAAASALSPEHLEAATRGALNSGKVHGTGPVTGGTSEATHLRV